MTCCLVRPDTYRDSVELMRVAALVEKLPGVSRAALMMATPANRELLAGAGLLDAAGATAGPNDLVVAVAAADRAAGERALGEAARLLDEQAAVATISGDRPSPLSIWEAVAECPQANLAIISTPGAYATAEALKALKRGLHAFIFTDNVPVAEEALLKQLAAKKKLLVMGPDCGTAILDGVPLGFANAVRRGPVGLVGASGTGLQEISCLVDRLGEGCSQVIGVGGHDLDERVGGLMMQAGIERLSADPGTRVIVLVSKPPAPNVARRVLDVARKSGKPVVVNFLGGDPAAIREAGAIPAATLEDAARAAVALARGKRVAAAPLAVAPKLAAAGRAKARRFGKGQSLVRGLYSGGTLCQEAALILEQACGQKHTTIDLGDDEFTVGRPHPMIDFRLRNERILAAAEDGATAVILLDVVLGYGAHPDPAGALVPAIEGATRAAARRKRGLAFVASVCGTPADPQGLERQETRLAAAGVLLAPSNAQAARLAASLVGHRRPARHAAPPEGRAEPVPAPRRKTSAGFAPFFDGGIRALNVGVAEFALSPRAHGASVLELDWRPPAGGDRDLGLLLARLEDDPDDPIGSRVAAANALAVERILAAKPMLVDIGRAADNVKGLGRRHLLHAGPPIAWARMCGPMRGAVIGAILYEGWADTPDAAERLADGGGISFAPCHHFGAVGPMAGILSPSMPVFIVENAPGGTRAFAILNDGMGKVLRFGAYGEDVLDRLRWMNESLAPALAQALRARGPVDLKNLTAQALQMGDECHNRNVAATSLFTRLIAPSLVRTAPADVAARVLEFLEANNHFYLNLSMAACKATMDAAHGIEGSTVVTAMARNGVEVGVRMSGTADAWFTAPAPVPDGLYFPGYGPADANPDLGDSAITETAGLGGLAMAAAPAIVRFIGGIAEEAIATTKRMYTITLARNNDFGIPALGFAGTPTGIDARRVMDSGVQPVFNTGIAHREAGVGQIGAGIAKAPLACFAGALRELGRRLKVPA